MALYTVSSKNGFVKQQTCAFCRSGDKEHCRPDDNPQREVFRFSVTFFWAWSSVFRACVGQLCALNIRADIDLYRKHVLVEMSLHNKSKAVTAKFHCYSQFTNSSSYYVNRHYKSVRSSFNYTSVQNSASEPLSFHDCVFLRWIHTHTSGSWK